MTDILEFFPYAEARESQKSVLEQIQRDWNSTDVFVVRVPVAGGKSAMSTTIQDWCLSQKLSAAITVPNNMLRDQYLEEFDWLRTLKKQSEYYLDRYKMTVERFMKLHKIKFGPKGCEYNEDRKIVRRVSTPIVTNFMAYQAHKLFRNVMIVDEAHQMLPVLQSIHAKKIWRHIHHYPRDATTVVDLMEWLETTSASTPALEKLRKEISSLTPATTIEFTQDWYKGEMMDCIKLVPMDVSGESPLFWPKKTKKLVLMSATISEADVENMGLSARRVTYIDAESEIPEENRPITIRSVGSMSYRNKAETLPKLVSEIHTILEENKGKKGFIHATYELAELLRTSVDSDRLIFHSKWDKKAQFDKFLARPEESGAVFVGSGMAEGIDLKYESGHFQIITKIPFPSLADPCARFLAVTKPRDYVWETSKQILQASGRICRSPDDFGHTYILDSDHEIWYNKAIKYGQVPAWFNPKEIK